MEKIETVESYPPKLSEDRSQMEPDWLLVNRCLQCIREADAHRMRGVLNRYILGWGVVNESKNPSDHPWFPVLVECRKTIELYAELNQ